MVEIILNILSSIKSSDKYLRYAMFLSLFLYLSFAWGINQSFISILERIFNFDITDILFITINYFVFAYEICFWGSFILCIVLYTYQLFESIRFSPLRFDTSFFKNWNKVTEFKNYSRLGISVYQGLLFFFVLINYLLFSILTICFLIISEKTSCDFLTKSIKNSLIFGGSFEYLGLIILSAIIIICRLWDWWLKLEEK